MPWHLGTERELIELRTEFVGSLPGDAHVVECMVEVPMIKPAAPHEVRTLKASRRKVLFVAHDVTLAHLGRPLQLANHLVAEGHDVSLAASSASERFLEGFGGSFHLLASTGKDRFIENLARGNPVFDFETLKSFAEEDEALLGAVGPELVVGDFRLSLSVTARRCRVPYASITNAYWSPAFSPRFIVPDLPIVRIFGVAIAQRLFDLVRPLAFAYHARPMNALRRHYGMASLGHDLRRIYTDADLALFSDVPEMYGMSATVPDSVFLGPIPWSPDVPLPDWWNDLDSRSPIIYVTLGSSGKAEWLPPLIDHLARMDVQLIVATAGARGVATRGKVYCADYIPGDAAAARAAVVVCNGGSPTSAQALAHGVPVLGIPGNLDQYLNMFYLGQQGVGITLRNQDLNPTSLQNSIHRLLHDDRFRTAAARIAGIYATYSPTQRFSAAIETLLAR